MQTSPELLTKIISVLSQINTNISSMKSGGPAMSGTADKSTQRAAGGIGINIGDLLQDKAKRADVKDTAAALKELSTSLGPLSSGITKFGLIPNSFKRSLTNFIGELLDTAQIRGVKASIAAREVAKAMNILGDALPKLAKGVFQFGIMQKTGLVMATSLGLKLLLNSLKAAADPRVLAGATALALVGVALKGIASVLKSIALVMLSFAGSIFIIVGAIAFASKMFGVGPLAAMGIVVGALAIFAGGFALIGLLSPLILGAGTAIASMGIGLGLMGLGLLAFVGSLALINKVTGDFGTTMRLLFAGAMMIGLMSLAFAGIGLLGGLIERGGKAAAFMGIGMAALGVGLMAIGGAFALISKWGVKPDEMFKSLIGGISKLALVFAGMGLFSLVILPGILTFMGMTFSLIMFGLALLELGAVMKKLGGPAGIEQASQNVANMIGIVTKGVIAGVMGGMGKDINESIKIEDLARFRIVKKSIKILGTIAKSVSQFAMGLSAFAKVGEIKELDYDEQTGKPKLGKTVVISQVTANIVSAFNTFITGLVTGTENLRKRQARSIKILAKGLTGKDGMISGIVEFSKALDAYAKFGKDKKIYIPEYDENGLPLLVGGKEKRTAIPISTIVTNIVETFGEFVKQLSDKAHLFTGFGTYATMLKPFNQALMGTQKRFGKSTPGILSSILEFSNVLNQFSTYSADNKIPITDENGKIIGSVPVHQVVSNMMSSLGVFITELNTQLKNKNLADEAEKIKGQLSSFTDIINQFSKLAESQEGIDKLASSMGNLASNVGQLVTNMDKLSMPNLEKLSNISAQHAVATAGVVTTTSGSTSSNAASQPDWDKFAEIIGQKISERIISFNTGEFQFRFVDSDIGNLTIKR